MIAFGCSMLDPELYARRAQPGIERTVEPDSEVFAIQAAGPINRSYNLIMARAAAFAELEALVLIDQDAEIVDPLFLAKVRDVLGDPDVGVVGCVGASGAATIAWWEGEVSGGPAVCEFGELGGGEVPAVAFGGTHLSQVRPPGVVDTLDGFVMVLSPWAVRNLRFDESIGFLYGYDFDFCLQVRAAGRKVMTADLGVRRHHGLQLVGENEPWIATHIRTADKWEGSIPGAEAPVGEVDWKARARLAEAEAALARLTVLSKEMQRDAFEAGHEERLREITDTLSWRITEPLRLVNRWRRRLARRLAL